MTRALPEIVVDSFAGGGGASEGIEAALRRMNALGQLPAGVEPFVTVAINHDDKALQMHAANHPNTLHLPHDVWKVDPRATVNGHPVGLLWASPDCRHHSKAKGGRPVSCAVRDLAWVVAHWAEQVRPRLIMLENVEEFRQWGPLTAENKPDKERAGSTFRQWLSMFTRLGYRAEWRELRACDYGAPTIRKRLYVIMRCDDEPIVWPVPTHGDPNSELVKAGKMKPWRTAAEIIDWDRPCPSILMNREEAKAYTAKTGVKLIRPLADNTEARIAKGIKRYVLDDPEPFVIDTGAFVSYGQQGGANRSAGGPLHTICASTKDTNSLVVPHMMTMRNLGKPHTAANEATHTVTAGGAGLSVVNAALAPHMVAVNHGDSGGRRQFPITDPFNTVTREQSRGLACAVMVKHTTGGVGYHPRGPAHTVTANSFIKRAGGASPLGIATAFMARQFGNSVGSHPEAPLGTVTAGGGGKTQTIAALLAQNNTGVFGHHPRDPLSTIVGKGSTQSVIAAHMLNLKGKGRRAGAVDDPLGTVTAGGQHHAAVSLPLMSAYYSEGGQWSGMRDPMLTIPTKARFGLVDSLALLPPMTEAQAVSARKVADFLRRHGVWDGGEFVTVTVRGYELVIVDIGMRMLTPRELARAQGFPDTYDLAAGSNGQKPLTDTDQRHKIGNSVCWQVAGELIYANYRPEIRVAERSNPQDWLFANDGMEDMPRVAAE